MKIVALAYNFKSLGDVAKKYPFFFFKNPDSIIGPSDTIKIPRRWHVWPEVELALRIGKDKYFDAIAVANDVTAKNVEGRDVHLAFSKGMDTFLPMSEWLEDFDLDWALRHADMYTAVNGVRVQTGKLIEMLWKPRDAYVRVSKFMTWKPGDILLMGTCYHDHYPLRDGDVVETDIIIDNDYGGLEIGITTNKVVEI